MFSFIPSLFCGMFPDVLYFTLFIIYTKKLKEKRLLLFSLLAVGYILLIMICRYEFIFYITYIVYGYLILKLLYKSHIIDLFLFATAFSYLMLLSFLLVNIIPIYSVAFIIDRILLFVPFLFRSKFNSIYLKYIKIWNRHKHNKIKSLTVRNTSVLFINILIFTINAVVIASMLMFLEIGG